MNWTDSYIIENGYDYFGNAAEDTLLFFVRDDDAPYVEPNPKKDNETITNLSDDTVNSHVTSFSTKEPDAEEQAEIFNKNSVDKRRNFDIDYSSEVNENKYEGNSLASSVAVPDANTEDDEFRQPIPIMAQKDVK